MNAIAPYSAIIAVVFSVIRPGWFTPWFDLLLWAEAKGRFGEFITKPLGLCHLCFAGMLGLVWSIATLPPVWASATTCIVNSCGAILLSAVINKVYEWSTS